jgi:hypothetical protein
MGKVHLGPVGDLRGKVKVRSIKRERKFIARGIRKREEDPFLSAGEERVGTRGGEKRVTAWSRASAAAGSTDCLACMAYSAIRWY